ncbi:YqgE/AlgH family protein [Parasegetibacter sp. NRK P23]|uniref:YqgE/AlgH family protein n=1 Tax=Parasegetibacter sp. NRK P23 TaxID=2942999 RepID=UPI0020445071|nr:YqgE/AlgH family protein [Parasegetibacter sp. NRK P23]MCM5527473.1 YqgE/AlgH family protein [Parasegetibacter sp. NRK P23]
MNQPATGTILIAEPFLKDPNFMRSVVLICEHQEEGSLGFVLNRHHQCTLDEVLPDMEGFRIPVFYGGPVQMDTLHFLHTYPQDIPGSFEITDGIFWGGDINVAMDLLKAKAADPKNFRFFIGYSGWSGGQLNEELKENSWILGQASKRLVFNPETSAIWKDALKGLGGDYELMVNFPIDPSLN